MIERIVLVPRWGAGPTDDWYPHLARTVTVPLTVVPLAPDPDAPTPAACATALRTALAGADPTTTLLVGHSVGCQVLIRHLATEPAHHGPFAGMLAVAGWWTVDEPWPALMPWLEPVSGIAHVRDAVTRVEVLLSTDDPYTADWRANRELWQQRVAADVGVTSGAQHYNRADEPAVVAALTRWCS